MRLAAHGLTRKSRPRCKGQAPWVQSITSQYATRSMPVSFPVGVVAEGNRTGSLSMVDTATHSLSARPIEPDMGARRQWDTCARGSETTAHEDPKPQSDRPFGDVHFDPPGLARCQAGVWRGLRGDVVRLVRREPFQSEFCGSYHLLIDYERAVRSKGESVLEGLPGSTLHDFSRKLTFVPAGHRFRETQEPRVLTQATYIQIDPYRLMECEGSAAANLKPRLFFDSPVLRHTALKLTALIETGETSCRLYAEALGVVLAHELLRLTTGTPAAPPERGGLAGWQRRVVAQYLEDHLAEQISLAELAALAQLSPYHFARAFR